MIENLVTLRFDEDDEQNIREVRRAGFKWIEDICLFEKRVRPNSSTLIDGLWWRGLFQDEFRPVSKELRSQIWGLTRKSFNHSRFFQDPLISEDEAWETYKNRLAKAYTSKQVWVFPGPDCVLGFVVFNRNSGEIDLIAVDSEVRRQGIGIRLVDACVESCKQVNLSWLRVRTQGTNVEAICFYEVLGFELVQVQKTFHLHLGGDGDACSGSGRGVRKTDASVD